MVQAKRANPRQPKFRPNRTQYNKLVETAQTYGAVPYYALYVQQPSPHDSAPTACPRALSASDRSIVLVAARASTDPGALPGRSLTVILSEARPLRCLADCACPDLGADPPGQPDPGSVWRTAFGFITRDFPGYQPASSQQELPPDVPAVRTNLSQYKPPRADTGSRRQSRPAGARTRRLGDDEVLLIRLGTQRTSPTPTDGSSDTPRTCRLTNCAMPPGCTGASEASVRGGSAIWSSRPTGRRWMPVRSPRMD